MLLFRTFIFMSIESVMGVPGVDNITLKQQIQDILPELCPGADVCLTEDSPQTKFGYLKQPSQFRSCCSDCSCNPGCEKNGDCCFPGTSEYKIYIDYYRDWSTCLFPMTIQPVGSKRIPYQSFYMVTSSPKNDTDGLYVNNITFCGNESVAPWGSLYPVYSARRKRIYMNDVCAIQNGATDGKHFDAVLSCTHNDYLDNSRFMVWPDLNSTPDGCMVNFFYPGNKEDISHLKCYTDLIDTCPGTGFNQSLYVTKLQEETVIKMCMSGLVSPFKSKDLYANVFCHICNEGFSEYGKFCEVHDGTILRAFDDRSFLGLIDGIFLTEKHNEKKTEGQGSPVICDRAMPDICKVIYCPSGQLRTLKGECTFTSTVWYNQDFTIHLNLSLTGPINVKEMFHSAPEMHKNIQNFESPWPDNWVVAKILYKIDTDDDGRQVTEFQVVVRNKLVAVNPKHLIHTIRTCVFKNWILRTNNKVMVLRSRFLPMTSFNNLPSTYALIYNRIRVVYNTFHVTKLFLCNQVELYPSEFSLNAHQNILKNNVSNRKMFDGEFMLVTSSSYDGVRARICVEDFESKMSGSMSVLKMEYILKLFAVLCVLYTIRR